jgi:hypothetical protein
LSKDDKLNVEQKDLLISRQNKGLGFLEHDVHPDEVAQLDWNLLREDLSLPVAVLYEEQMLHNLKWMQRFMTIYDVKLAPHGKTTMAPRLFDLQVRGGAWGITLATAHQSFVAWRHGLRRILMANQLVGKQNMTLVSHMIEDPALSTFASWILRIRLTRSANFFRCVVKACGCCLKLALPEGVAAYAMMNK